MLHKRVYALIPCTFAQIQLGNLIFSRETILLTLCEPVSVSSLLFEPFSDCKYSGMAVLGDRKPFRGLVHSLKLT